MRKRQQFFLYPLQVRRRYYNAGDLIPIIVSFSEIINVVNPITLSQMVNLTLETGENDIAINYASGTGTSNLTFNYIVSAGHTSNDLDYISTNALTLNNSTITDIAGNAAVVTTGSGETNSLGANKAIVIDTESPTITSVTSSAIDGTYKVDDVIPILVTFSEAVFVTDVPQITLETGETDAIASYASGSETATLTFNYTVLQGHTSLDLDYVSTEALALNGGTILDIAQNTGVLTLPAPGAENSLGGNKNLIVDTTLPMALSVNSNALDNTYKVGDLIPITVTFNEAVNVTGTPQHFRNR